MVVTAEFIGGPAHGMVRSFEGEEPPSVVTYVVPSPFRLDNPHAVPLPVVRIEYERQVSQLDDGPLWVYVRRGGGAAVPA